MDKTIIVSAARSRLLSGLAAIRRFGAEHRDKPVKARDWVVRQTRSAKETTLRQSSRAREALKREWAKRRRKA
jgi:hypothetical protein